MRSRWSSVTLSTSNKAVNRPSGTSRLPVSQKEMFALDTPARSAMTLVFRPASLRNRLSSAPRSRDSAVPLITAM